MGQGRGWTGLAVAAVGAGVVLVSIAASVILGTDIPEPVWVLLVPVGMLGGGVTAVVALGLHLARR